jgi:hypothetical protein
MASNGFPDFLIIGAMKAGTTSLFRWLGQQEEVFMPARKEPNFFSDDSVWSKGLRWYADLFSDATSAHLRGEASVKYTHPECSDKVARRIRQTMPGVRLIFLARHPVERLRSHYLHQVKRGREKRSLASALAQPHNEYVLCSMYERCMRPYFDLFPMDQICVVRFEDLISTDASGWESVLSHLGMAHRARPKSAHNVTSEKGRFTRPMLWIWKRGLLRKVDAVPRPLRTLGKRILIRGTGRRAQLLTAADDVDEELLLPIWNDTSTFEERLGLDGPLWDRSSTT